MRKEKQIRHEGIAWAVRYLEEHNGDLEALKAETKKRGIYGIPIGVSPKAKEDFEQRIKRNCIRTICTVACVVLRDVYGFGASRLDRFVTKFNQISEDIDNDYCTWDDWTNALRKEANYSLPDVRYE